MTFSGPIQQLLKALEAGRYSAAPAPLVQGQGALFIEPLKVEPLKVATFQMNRPRHGRMHDMSDNLKSMTKTAPVAKEIRPT